MSNYDFAVKHDGKLLRFISDGDKAAIFDRDGAKQNLTITEPATGMRAPKVVDENGVAVVLSRVSKPCSCKGGVWRKRPSELVAQL